jgi:hypothetical protein
LRYRKAHSGWGMPDRKVPELVWGLNEALWLYKCWNTALGISPLNKTGGE